VGSSPIIHPNFIKPAGVAELADAPDLGSGGFSHGGSSPFSRTNYIECGNSSAVEHRLAKARVAGSNPVFRSKKKVKRPLKAFFALFF
jgi:hypothetical protein